MSAASEVPLRPVSSNARMAQYGSAGLVILSFVILVIASTYHLTDSPAIWYDEGFYTQIAQNVADFGREGLQIAPGVLSPTSYVTVGYPLVYPVALAYRVFGTSVLVGRAVMVLYIALFALAAYLFMRTLFGARLAAWSLLLLATFPMLYGNGKSVLGEVPGLFFMTLTLIAVIRFEQGRKTLGQYALIGLAAGLCVATKPIYVLLPLAIGISALFYWRSLALRISGILVGALAFLAPLALWALLQFGPGTSVSAVVSAYANPYEVGNIGHLILANLLGLFTNSTPLYLLALVATWGISLFVRRRSRSVSLAETSAFLFTLLIMLDYLRLEGWYRYLFPGATIALLFLPSSLVVAWTAVSKRLTGQVRFLTGVFVCIIGLSAVQLYQTAFSSYVAEYYTSTRAEDVGAAVDALGPNASLFLYDAPELAILLPSRNYYQYIHPHPQLEIGAAELPVLAAGTATYVIASADTYTAASSTVFAAYGSAAYVNHYVILKRD